MPRLAIPVLIVLMAMIVAAPSASAQTAGQGAQEAYAQASRPRVIIVPPRKPGPNSKRICRTQLVQEYRASGTVIVPQTFCWWR